MTALSPTVRVRGLSKSFGPHLVLDGLDLDIYHGETLVILGGSGSGKSTLLRCLIGLEKPDTGSILFEDRDLCDSSSQQIADLRRRMGVAFQGGALFGSMTVAENVELPLRELTRLADSTRRIVVQIKLALVGLDAATDRYPAELSGGMQKRAAFARAIALDPEFLFCDEPSAGLDPVTAAGLDQLLNRLSDVFGLTLVVVTHELDSAFAIADRIALMHRGRFLVVGEPDRVQQSDDPIVRRFLNRTAEDQHDQGLRYRRLIEAGSRP